MSDPNPPPPHPLAWIDDELVRLEREGRRRRLSTREGPQGPRIVVDGEALVHFGSNDYLGLAADPRLAAAASEAARTEGWGSGASPLVLGRARPHRELERRLAEFEGTEAALVFASGFAANAGAVAALVGPGDAVFSDRKNHASLLDGCRLSRADVRVYPHGDWQELDRLLTRTRARRCLVATDSLFSMDGDLAPLVELVAVCEKHGAMLLIDEAHATGVFGPSGRGVAEALGVEHRVPVRVGTLSKALGSAGGFVVGSRSLIEWLVNTARPYVFSTAGPAATAAAALAALEIVRREPQRRETLLARAATLRQQLRDQGWNVGSSASQIVPLVVGDVGRAVRLSHALRRRGVFVPAIRPPTVPEGEACLRISLTCAHTDEMVAELVEALRQL
ncbi:MAG: 8-amino-7-oxononanoate synthase [Thermoguttaceae bacterium]|jgi:8-amino-7-oxononanoate synthase|nr:8-amino-7-oxononanoate synthase [Thermoguttaceae bacterium]